MTTYTVQGPSGATYTIEGPPGATADQLGQAILQNSPKERQAAEYQREKAQYDPTNDMSTGERLLAAYGRGVASLGRGIGGLLGLTSQDDVNEAKATDAPLMATTAGKIGSALGQGVTLAPVAFIPGANTVAGAAATGAGTGALTTEGGLTDRALGAAGGAIGGAAGQKAGQLIGDGASALQGWAQNYLAKQAPRQTAVAATQGAGYVLPPNEVAPTLQNWALNAFAGPRKTMQQAAATNQQTTNSLAARALGLPADQPLSLDALNAVRANAGKAYQAVAQTGQVAPTPAYDQALDAIVAPYQAAAAGFPNASPSPVIDTINGLRSPGFDAGSAVAKISQLRDEATKAYGSGDAATGRALKTAANAIEDQLDQHLQATGQSANLLQEFQDARKLIAQSYEVQRALKGDNVNAARLASVQSKTGRLTGDLATIADSANAFPKALALPTETPSPWSALDAMNVAGSSGLASVLHNPLVALPAAASVARPAVRSFILSQPGQAMATVQPGPTLANALALALQNQAVPAGLMVGGVTQGANLLAR